MLWNALICAIVLMLPSQAYTSKDYIRPSDRKRELFNEVSDFDYVLEPIQESSYQSSVDNSDLKPVIRRSSQTKHFLNEERVDSKIQPLKFTNTIGLNEYLNYKEHPSRQYEKLRRKAILLQHKGLPEYSRANLVKRSQNVKLTKRLAGAHHGTRPGSKINNSSSECKPNFPSKSIVAHPQVITDNKNVTEEPNDEKMKSEKGSGAESLSNSNSTMSRKFERALGNPELQKLSAITNQLISVEREKLVPESSYVRNSATNAVPISVAVTPTSINARIEGNMPQTAASVEHIAKLADIAFTEANPTQKVITQTELELKTVTSKSVENIPNGRIPPPDNTIEEDTSVQIFEFHRKRLNNEPSRKPVEIPPRDEIPVKFDRNLGNSAYRIEYPAKEQKVKSVVELIFDATTVKATEPPIKPKSPLDFEELNKEPKVSLRNPQLNDAGGNVENLSQKSAATDDGISQLQHESKNLAPIYNKNNKIALQKMPPLPSFDLSQQLLNLNPSRNTKATDEAPSHLSYKRNGLRKVDRSRLLQLNRRDRNSDSTTRYVKKSISKRYNAAENLKTKNLLYGYFKDSESPGRDTSQVLNNYQNRPKHEFVLKPMPPQGFMQIGRRMFRGFHGAHHQNLKVTASTAKMCSKSTPTIKSVKVKRNVQKSKDTNSQTNSHMKDAYKILNDLESLGKTIRNRKPESAMPSRAEKSLNARFNFDPVETLRSNFLSTTESGFHIQLNPELLQKIDAIRSSIQNAMSPISIVKLNAPQFKSTELSPTILEKLNELRAVVENSISTSNIVVDATTQSNLMGSTTTNSRILINTDKTSIPNKLQPVAEALPSTSSPLTSTNPLLWDDKFLKDINVQRPVNNINEKKSSSDGVSNYDYYDDYLDQATSKLDRAARNLPDDSSAIFGRLQHQVRELKALDLQTLKKIREHMNSIQTLLNAASKVLITLKNQTHGTINTETSSPFTTALTQQVTSTLPPFNQTSTPRIVHVTTCYDITIIKQNTTSTLGEISLLTTGKTSLPDSKTKTVLKSTTPTQTSNNFDKTSTLSPEDTQSTDEEETHISDNDRLFEEQLLRTILEVYQYLTLFRSNCNTNNNVVDDDSTVEAAEHFSLSDVSKTSDKVSAISSSSTPQSSHYEVHRVRDTGSSISIPNGQPENITSSTSDNKESPETSTENCNTLTDTTTEDGTEDFRIMLALLKNNNEGLTSNETEDAETNSTQHNLTTLGPTPSLTNTSTISSNDTSSTRDTMDASQDTQTPSSTSPTLTPSSHKLHKYSLLLQALLNSKHNLNKNDIHTRRKR